MMRTSSEVSWRRMREEGRVDPGRGLAVHRRGQQVQVALAHRRPLAHAARQRLRRERQRRARAAACPGIAVIRSPRSRSVPGTRAATSGSSRSGPDASIAIAPRPLRSPPIASSRPGRSTRSRIARVAFLTASRSRLKIIAGRLHDLIRTRRHKQAPQPRTAGGRALGRSSSIASGEVELASTEPIARRFGTRLPLPA